MLSADGVPIRGQPAWISLQTALQGGAEEGCCDPASQWCCRYVHMSLARVSIDPYPAEPFFVGQSVSHPTNTGTPAMVQKSPVQDNALTESEEVFEKAAEIFRVMSAPMRLRIISALCNGEKNVGELLAEIDTTQPNMSQHLNTLYQAGVLGKRRDGVQIFYRIVNERVVTLCRAVCVQIASDEA